MKRSTSDPPFAKKSFGQNFLIDQNYIDKIISVLDLSEADTVIEIGPGRGALTEKLLERADKVIAIELDRDMVALLKERFGRVDNFQTVEQDALETDFAALLDPPAGLPRSAKLVANLPYYISTAILQRLIEQRRVFSTIVLMFQREVVERMTAPPGSTERGFLTVLVEAYMAIEELFDVPPQAFRPVPKVWSSVVRLTPKPSPVADDETFRRVVSCAFAQKRKTILNNLKRCLPKPDPVLKNAGIDGARRAETLTAVEWEKLTNAFIAAARGAP